MNNKHGIANWKIYSEEEKKLAEQADLYENKKIEYVEFYKNNDPIYYEKGLIIANRMIDAYRKNVNLTQRNKYIIDMVYSLHRFGCMFDEYFMFNFEEKNFESRNSYITDKNRWDYYYKLNDKYTYEVFTDKYKSYIEFKKFYKREMILIEDGFDIFNSFINTHKQAIIKPRFDSGGRGIYIVRQSDFKNNMEIYQYIKEQYDNAIIEEVIIQDEKIASLHSSSINTVRFPTLKINGEIILFHPYLRCGIGKAIIDNVCNGGFGTLIDCETGILKSTGKDHYLREYIMHPDSKVIIPGFKIPHFEKAIEMVKELAKQLPGNNYTGWDLALTSKGWVLVEGNHNGQLDFIQVALNKGIKEILDTAVKDL